MTTLDRYLMAGKQAGCSPDQLRYFRQAGIVLQPKQLQASSLARLCDQAAGPTQIGFGGARGGGKSHWLLAQMCADDCQRREGLKCLLLRKVGKAVRESFEDLRGRVLMGMPHEYKRSDAVLSFPNGSRVILGHFKNESDIDAYLGLEYDVIGIEEATTLSHSKYKAIRTCSRTSRLDWRPRIYSTANPGGVGHAWYKQRYIAPFRAGTEEDTRFVPATVDDNHFVDPGYVRKLNELTGWMRRAWRYGDWDIAAGQFFITFRNDVHVVNPFPIPKDWRVWAALDYGYQHFTVVHLLAESNDGVIYHVDEHAARRWQVGQHATAIRQMLARWGMEISSLDTFVAGSDVFAKRDDGPTVAQKYKAEGIRLRPANQDRVNGWAELLARLGDMEAGVEPTWYIFSSCRRLIETLPMLEHNPRNPEDVLKVNVDEDGLGGDDAADAARYGLMASWTPKMKSARVDFYRQKQEMTTLPPPARTDAEIEELLSRV